MTESTIPTKYVLAYHSTSCRNCGALTFNSQFFAVALIHSRNGLGLVKQSTPCDHPTLNIPVERQPGAPRHTPYCYACPSIDLSHLPPPPSAAQVRTMAEPAAKPRPTVPTRPQAKKPSIFDLA